MSDREDKRRESWLIQPGESARVLLDKDGKQEINVKAVDEGELRIYCDGTLLVLPWTTNSIRLRVER